MNSDQIKPQRVLVVSGGFESVPGIRAILDAGIDVAVLDGDASAPGFELVADKLVVSTYDPEGAAEAAAALHARRPFDGVLSIAADVPTTVAAIQARLGLPGQLIEDARVSSDKIAMKERFEACGVPTTWHREVTSEAELESVVGDSEEFLIKPADSRGARGVQRLLKGVVRSTAFVHAREVSPSNRVLLERFVHGPQLSTESLIDGDRVVTLAVSDRNYEHLGRFAPYIIENGGLLPSRMYAAVADKIDVLTLASARALGVRQGVIKGDVIWTAEGPIMIEAAPRISGGWLATDQVPLATRESLVVHAARLAMGISLPTDLKRPTFHQAVCVRYFFPPAGRVTAIDGLADLRSEPWIQRLEMFLQVGDEVPHVTDHTRRAGLVLVTGSTRDEAEARAIASVQRVRFSVE